MSPAKMTLLSPSAGTTLLSFLFLDTGGPFVAAVVHGQGLPPGGRGERVRSGPECADHYPVIAEWGEHDVQRRCPCDVLDGNDTAPLRGLLAETVQHR